MDKKYCDDQERLARYAKAMSHPARLAILCYLAHQDDCCFGELFEHLPIAKATVSQHLAELRDAGLIKADNQPPRVRYCIDRDNWQTARKMMNCFWEQCAPEKHKQ